jgi:hypothetical protein
MMPSMPDQMTAQIATELGIGDLPLPEQQQLIAQFGEVALKAATLSVLEKLSEEKRGEFMSLSEGGDPAAVQAFLDREVPGHDAIAKAAVALEVKKFKEVTA